MAAVRPASDLRPHQGLRRFQRICPGAKTCISRSGEPVFANDSRHTDPASGKPIRFREVESPRLEAVGLIQGGIRAIESHTFAKPSPIPGIAPFRSPLLMVGLQP